VISVTDQKSSKVIKVVVLVTFLAMVVVNALANALPINGITTGDVSDSFPNLFAPTGLTFSIWGLIYLLLFAYTLYQFGLFQDDKGASKAGLFTKIGVLFSISSIANALWIFAWHYYNIALSLLLMLILLIMLVLINLALDKEKLNSRDRFFIRLPFAVYFGWITVATVANVTSLLVYSGWSAFGIADQVWAVIIIAVGLIIGAATTIRFKSYAYGLVIIWAYSGIWIRHTAESGFNGQYSAVIATVIISIILMVAVEVYLFFKRPEAAEAA
jgi:hypothetical protein